MKTPEIQARLIEIAAEIGNDEIRDLAVKLSRRKPKSRAVAMSEPMSDEIRHRIRRMHKSNPDLPMSRIAAALNLNPGRVSETLRGYRT